MSISLSFFQRFSFFHHFIILFIYNVDYQISLEV